MLQMKASPSACPGMKVTGALSTVPVHLGRVLPSVGSSSSGCGATLRCPLQVLRGRNDRLGLCRWGWNCTIWENVEFGNRDENGLCHRETREVKGVKMRLGLLMTYLGEKRRFGVAHPEGSRKQYMILGGWSGL